MQRALIRVDARYNPTVQRPSESLVTQQTGTPARHDVCLDRDPGLGRHRRGNRQAGRTNCQRGGQLGQPPRSPHGVHPVLLSTQHIQLKRHAKERSPRGGTVKVRYSAVGPYRALRGPGF